MSNLSAIPRIFDTNYNTMTPISRTENLVVQRLDDETIIYDLKADKVLSLNETSAFVWNRLDGKTGIDELAVQISNNFNQPADEELVWLAIDELRKCDLLGNTSLPEPISKVKRREAIKRIGLASMIALPMISMLIAPTALHAQSGGPIAICMGCSLSPGSSPCVAGSTCKDNLCAANTSSPTFLTGAIISVADAPACTNVGTLFCCRGTATFTAPNICSCN